LGLIHIVALTSTSKVKTGGFCLMVNKRFSTRDGDAAALVKEGVDIVDVVGQVVKLRRVGNRHLGLCPFHQEKTPSFQVDAENQLYYCFGCGNGGDVLSFVMKSQNLSFGEALQSLAERYHINLPREEQSPAQRESKKESDQLHQVLDLAGKFFTSQLHHSPAGELARRYLEQRGLPARVVEEQAMGYAPNRWDGLLLHLRQAGLDPQLGVKAGLLVAAPGERLYDRFRHRLIFPITNDRGKIVAFGGRSLDGSEPKYLNSPETALFHKGRMLYNLARAREACRQIRQVVVVEGYMDLLAFHAQGFYRVAATLGTALTPQQVRLLARLADEVVLLYDADEAGQRAMMRALPLFLQEPLAVSCPALPAGLDPDDFLKAEGLEGFQRVLQDRQDLGQVAIGKILARWDGTTAGKTSILDELQPLLESVQQPVLLDEYLRLVADRLALSQAVIQSQLRRKGRQQVRPSTGQAPGTAPRLADHHTQTPEESIVRLMIKYPSLIEKFRRSGALDHFQETKLRSIAEELTRMEPVEDAVLDLARLYDRLPDPELQRMVAGLLLQEDGYGALEVACLHLDDRLGALHKRREKRSRKDLLENIRKAERAGNDAEVKALLQQLQSLCFARGEMTPGT
jgi:DNA primase